MTYVQTWKGGFFRLANWFVEDPRRLVMVITVITLLISILAFIAFVNGLNVPAIKLAPNPPGGGGGSG